MIIIIINMCAHSLWILLLLLLFMLYSLMHIKRKYDKWKTTKMEKVIHHEVRLNGRKCQRTHTLTTRIHKEPKQENEFAQSAQ